MKHNKMSFLINSLTSGGAERVLTNIITELDRQNYEIELICLEKNNFYTIPKNVKIIYLSNSGGKLNSILKLLSIPILAYKLKRYVKLNNIKLLQSHVYRANFVNTLSKLFGSRHTVQIVNTGQVSMYKSKGLAGKVNLFLIRNLYPFADTVICKSNGMLLDLQSYFKQSLNVDTIYNPYNIQKIQSLSLEDVNEFVFDKNKKYILYVGRFASFKKPEYVIKSLKNLDKNIELILLGDGPKKVFLKKLSQSLGVNKRVHFLGRVSNPYKFMSNSNLFILSSDDGEGFPNVLVEAMICKVGVLSSDCKSGPREILSPLSNVTTQLKTENEITENGILFPVGNVSKLTEAIELMLNDRHLHSRCVENAYKRAHNFSQEAIIKKYKKVLEIE